MLSNKYFWVLIEKSLKLVGLPLILFRLQLWQLSNQAADTCAFKSLLVFKKMQPRVLCSSSNIPAAFFLPLIFQRLICLNAGFFMEPAPTLDLSFTLCSIPFTSIAHFSLFILPLAHVFSPLWVLIQVCRGFSCSVFRKLKDTVFEKPWIWKQPVHLQAVTFSEMQVLHFPWDSLLYSFSPSSALLMNTCSQQKKIK